MRIQCPQCEAEIAAPSEATLILCPHCGQSVPVRRGEQDDTVITARSTSRHGTEDSEPSTATDDTLRRPRGQQAGAGRRIRFNCPGCQRELTVPAEERPEQCPHCGEPLTGEDPLPTARTLPTARAGAREAMPGPAEGADTRERIQKARQAVEWMKEQFRGRYEILDFIASGGMGAVFKARQLRPSRVVALKVMRGGQFASPRMTRRFEREAQAVALLQHPGIVPVYEYGEVAGQPYFTMEYVEGKDLLSYARDNELSHQQMCRLIVRVCDAVSYAHEHGVVHRDLKPGNIIVDEMERPRILDFGLSRVSADAEGREFSMLTVSGEMFGTPRYMSPEQALGHQSQVDEQTDVFALGAILFEMVVGVLPYPVEQTRGMRFIEVLNTSEPVRPSALHPHIDPDLEIILLTAVARDKAERYPSVDALGEDLENWLADRPITARPATPLYRLRKWCWRNRRVLTPLAVAGLVMVTLTFIFGARLSDMAARMAGLRKERERLQGWLAGADNARQRVEQLLRQGEWQRALWGLEDFAAAFPEEADFDYLRREVRRSAQRAVSDALSEFLRLLRQQDYAAARAHAREVSQLANRLPEEYGDLRATLLDAQSDFDTAAWEAVRTEVERAYTRQDAVSRLEQFLQSEPGATYREPAQELLHKARTRPQEHYLHQHVLAFDLAVSRQQWRQAQEVLASLSSVLADGEQTEEWTQKHAHMRRHLGLVVRPAAAHKLGTTRAVAAHPGWVESLSFVADGSLLVSATKSETDLQPVAFWSLPDLSPQGRLSPGGVVTCAATAPDGHLLALGTQDGQVQVWSLRDRVLDGRAVFGEREVMCVQFTARGESLLAADAQKARIWPTRSTPEAGELLAGRAPAAHSPTQPLVALAQSGGGVILWHVEDRRVAGELATAGSMEALAFGPDGRRLATAHREERDTFGYDRIVTIWDVQSAQPLVTLPPVSGLVQSLAFSPDGRLLAAAAGGIMAARLHVWEVDSAALLWSAEPAGSPRAVSFSPNQIHLAAGFHSGEIVLYGVPPPED